MNITNKILAGIILILFLLLRVQGCTINKQDDLLKDYQTMKVNNEFKIDSLQNKLGQAVTQTQVIKVSSSETIKALSDSVFNLKKKDENYIKEYQALYRIKQLVKIDSIPIRYTDTNDYEKVDTSGMVRANEVIIPPRSFSDSTKDYTIRGRVLLQGISLDVVSLPDTVSLRVVEVKEGFFKGRRTVAQVIHSNSLIKTEGIQAITLTQKKTFWQKVLPKLALIVGIYIGTKL